MSNYLFRGFKRYNPKSDGPQEPRSRIVLDDEIIDGWWVYGSLLNGYVIVPDHQWIGVTNNKISNEFDAYRVISDTVCRYTGIDDRNGRPIFENDRLGIPKHVVRYVNGGYEIGAGQPLWIAAPYGEVIGNIFEE